MNVAAWLVWGFGATVVLTAILAGSQAAGLTRMNIPYILGTLFTPDRDRARLIGVFAHLINGWIFSLVYVVAFHTAGVDAWWFGATIGLVHGLFLLAVALPALPGLHPRMAGPEQGPTSVRQLEPPGFLAMHYGWNTPASVVFAHVVFGTILGGFYAI
jgi:hypothetical protein